MRKVAKDSGSETTSELHHSYEKRLWSGEWMVPSHVAGTREPFDFDKRDEQTNFSPQGHVFHQSEFDIPRPQNLM